MTDSSSRDHEDLFAGSPYQTVRRLAAGGMGEVFLVQHRELERQFVAKVLHKRFASNERLLDRMRVEAQTLGRLNHPNVISVCGVGITPDGRPFIILERLLGRTLAAETEARGALPPREAIAYVLQLLAGLEAGHALGIVHRDIKPENLFLVDRPDGTRLLKLLDYGIARVLPGLGENAPEPLAWPTETGLVVGTPRYVSPEGALGKKVDERADLYAAGLILYLLLTGRGPFDHIRGETNILRAHVKVQPDPPSAAVDSPSNQRPWPSILDHIVLCALHKDPNTRFQSATQFRDALREFVEQMAAPRDAELAAGHQVSPSSAQPDPGAPPEPQPEAPSSAELQRLPMSTPGLRELLTLFAVASTTAVATSQLVRLILTYRQ